MKKRTAVVLISNEVVFRVLNSALQKAGVDVRCDTESAVSADFAVITPYFMELGVLNQLRSENPDLPVVLIADPGHKANGNGRFFYDILEMEGRSAIDADEKISRWFSEGQGKFLIQSGGSK